jgi:NTE family protein
MAYQLLIGLGFTRKETKEILWSLDFNKFLDDSWGVIRDTRRLIGQFGWYKGKGLNTLLSSIS